MDTRTFPFNLRVSKQTVSIIGFVCIALLLVGGSFYVGYARGAAHPQTILVKGLTNVGDPDVTADFSVFWQAWDLLKTTHLKGGEVKD